MKWNSKKTFALVEHGVRYTSGTGFPFPVTDCPCSRAFRVMAMADTSEFLVSATFSGPIISSVNHCVMSPTFRATKLPPEGGKRETRENKGCDRFHAGWRLREARERIDNRLPSCILRLEDFKRDCSERQSEGERGQEEKRKWMPSGYGGNDDDDDGEDEGGWERASAWILGWRATGEDRYGPGNWVTLTEGIAFAAARPSFPYPPPHAASQPLLSVSRSDTTTTTATCFPSVAASTDYRFLIYGTSSCFILVSPLADGLLPAVHS